MKQNYDFCGWATRNGLRCSDGRTIMTGAFKDDNGKRVPLVWNHEHNDPDHVLGHAILENRDEGVYAYGFFNETESGQTAKQLVQHGDVSALSIYANQLKEQNKNVMHGMIREVSLVLAGANPGAYINSVIQHSDGTVEEDREQGVLYTGETIEIAHSDISENVNEPEKQDELIHADQGKEPEMAEEKKTTGSEKTVGEVYEAFNDEQKLVVMAIVDEALKQAGVTDDSEEDENVKHNIFEGDNETNTLSHADTEAIFSDVKRYGSLRDSALAHGIEQIDFLFPEAQSLNNPPDFIKRETTWVNKVMGGVHHTPFSRIKSMFADITEDEARAKGYIKGNYKTEEVFGLLRRTTTPTTIYKKQKLDRDDIVDITDFDVVSWLKGEMRMMLDEELARAYMIGDGRSVASADKINEGNIRPIWTDDDLYTIKTTVTVASNATPDQIAKATIRAIIKSRKNYKGTGNPTFYTTEDVLTDMLLMEDSMGRVIYDTEEKLRTALRVKEIVTIPVFENQSRDVSGVTHNLVGLIVNLQDYNVGADKGGSINLFDDFDIDYNQQKYLIETRCSGALIKPYSAIAVETVTQ